METPNRRVPQTMAEKILARASGRASVRPGDEIEARPDFVVSYDFPTDLPRYTFADLPEHIDYVVITHGHADHLMFEPLLQLRHRIGTVVVPAAGGGRLADPSLKLMLKHAGFRNVVALAELESLPVKGGELIGLPFIGEHGDLDIQAKLAHLVKLEGKSLLMAADSNALEPRLYEHVHREVGPIDMMWLGMESEGGPLSWMYGPLLPTPLQRKMDQSRRLNGSNAVRAIEIVQRLKPGQVYIYAMGREPWMGHVMVMGYHENSPQLVESRKLLAYCAEHGIRADMPYVQAEYFLR